MYNRYLYQNEYRTILYGKRNCLTISLLWERPKEDKEYCESEEYEGQQDAQCHQTEYGGRRQAPRVVVGALVHHPSLVPLTADLGVTATHDESRDRDEESSFSAKNTAQ